MSDYLFMLESHLSSDQNRALAHVRAAAAESNVNVFLTGGAMRDMLGGFHIRDLDFSVEGPALKVAKSVAERSSGEVLTTDENRRSAELLLPGAVRVQVAMARQERYAKSGSKPQVTPAAIQDDLRGRDFSVNAIALSLNRGSLGLLLDPANGLADLDRRELRALSTYGLYDDPSRILRLIRLRVRLGFTLEGRTASQYANARAARVEELIPPRTLFGELRAIAEEPNPSEVIRALQQEGLLGIFSPALGDKVDLHSLGRLERAIRMLPDTNGNRRKMLAPFLFALTEKLSPKEKSAFIHQVEMSKGEVDFWHKLEPRARKVEQALKSAKVKKPSHVYQVLAKADMDEILYLLYRSSSKPVHDRIRNYLQKYLPMVQEMPASELARVTAAPGTPKYEKERQDAVFAYLNRRPKKPAEEATE